MRNAQRAAKSGDASEPVVAEFGYIESRDGVRLSVEGGIAEDGSDAAVVERAACTAVAEGGKLREGRRRSVVEAAAIDKQAIVG